MISDGIKQSLKNATKKGTTIVNGNAVFSVMLTFDELLALMEKVDEWNASQNRD